MKAQSLMGGQTSLRNSRKFFIVQRTLEELVAELYSDVF